MVMLPIILDPSDPQSNLVKAIKEAERLGVPLLLKPGTHFTQPGRRQRILIGRNGLKLGVAPPPFPFPPHRPAIIKRPNNAINLQAPDYNYGLFFIPSAPTVSEVAGITWKPYVAPDGDSFEFGIIIRGDIEITGILVDCNMDRQELVTLPKEVSTEHSAMLGFAGEKYFKMFGPDGLLHDIPLSPSNVPRRVYVGFRSVALRNMGTLHGGFADDVWISRGYFNPNIERVVIEKFSSQERINGKRATISFSEPCQTIQIKDVDIYKLEMEEDIEQQFHKVPRRSDLFTPSAWTLARIKAERIGLAAKGNVYVLKATALNVSRSLSLLGAGGSITDSSLPAGSGFRLFRLNNLLFDRVTWQFEPDGHGVVHGLRPVSQEGDPCIVTFRGNVFQVAGDPKSGQLINSEYSSSEEEHNSVTVSLAGCTYPEPFGRSTDLRIAQVRERGDWTFVLADLGTRDPKVAIKEGTGPGIYLHLV